MARYANPLMLDAALDYLADSDRICVCETEPTTYTEAISTFNLATIDINSGSFTKAAGGVSGRKSTLSACSGSVSTSGSALHMAVVSSASALVYVWVLTEQYLTAGNTITTPALYAEVQDPVAP